ncbi:hypothetical protein [Actinomadura opuntiae]|uniref:hypothetical protein n=1 Tax=Actinomadura sp. OS1-43 TaxID=604315 RepID=UPI00255B2BC2|nr:hypothetical protein [Actinomadura sp. OS1-43]MDL4815987.1 hypothetical protein [Actinomadura sp. OS1-43]
MLSERTDEVLYEFPDEPLWLSGGRLVPVRDQAVLYAVNKARWVRRHLATMP